MKKVICVIFILCALFSGCRETVTTFNREVSDKSQGWGFRRTKDGPEFTAEQISQMNEYNCIFKEETKEKVIYLTFDEGYENGYTSVILDTLREKGVKAAFFVTAPYVKSNPDLIKRMSREGHIIGNHTVGHPSLPTVTDTQNFEKELIELDRLVYGVCKKNLVYLRPPKGEYSERTLMQSKNMGYINVFWSDTYVDWNDNVTAKEAHDTVTANFHPGEVLLLHAVSKGNADALSMIIDTAHKNGYTFKSLDEYSNG